MKKCGFTHGGFYNHFKSKDELAAEAIASAFDEHQLEKNLCLRLSEPILSRN
jgi:AcrR family transcriptional regulator